MAEFKVRLAEACRRQPDCPQGHGSAAWLRRELKKGGVEVSGQCVSNWQHGKTRPRDETLAALSGILGVRPAWLLGLDADERDEVSRPSDPRSLRISLGGDRIFEITQIPNDFTEEDAVKVSKLILALAN